MESSRRQAHGGESHGLCGVPWRPLAISLGLHFLLFGWLAEFPAAVSPPGDEILTVSMRTVPVEVASRPVQPVIQRAPPISPRPLSPQPPVQPSAAVIAIPAAVPAAVMPAPTLAAEIAPTELQDSAPAASPAAPLPIAKAASEVGLDAGGLRQYRVALASQARQFRRYPEAARRGALTGTAEVRVTIEAAGGVRRTELNKSSGHAALDAAALEMLRQAAARTDLPASLRGQSFAVLLPVVFAVED